MPAQPDSNNPSAHESPAVPLNKLATEKAGALQPQDSVQTAGDRMREHDAADWPVAEDRKLIGVVADKNPDWQLGGRGHDPQAWQVGQIMKRELIFCYEAEDCASADKLMSEHGLRYLPVVDREMRIVGIFSREEIANKVESKPATSEEPASE